MKNLDPGVYKKSMSGLVTTWDLKVSNDYLSNEIVYTITKTLDKFMKDRFGSYISIGAFPREDNTGFYVITRIINRVKIHEAISDYSLYLQRIISLREDHKNLRGAKNVMLDYYDKYLRFSYKAEDY